MKAFRVIRAFPGFVWDVAKEWYYGGLGDLAAGVVFWFLITIPAAVLGLVSALGFLENIVGSELTATIQQDVVDFIERVFTADADSVETTVEELFQQTNGSFLALSIGLTLFTISRGFAGMIRALDTVYDVVDGRTWYHTRIVGLILGLGSVLIAVPIVLLEVFLWSEVDVAQKGSVKAGIAMLILVVWASIIFHYGPATRSKWRWDLPGAVVAAAFWWALTFGFNVYVELVSRSTNNVLGAIGGGILALTWIWLAAQVLLIGAAVNSILGDRLGLDRGRRPWKITEALANTTGEIKKVVLPEPKQIELVDGEPVELLEASDPKVRRVRMKARSRARQQTTDETPVTPNGSDAAAAVRSNGQRDSDPTQPLAARLPEKPLARPLDLSQFESTTEAERIPFFDLEEPPVAVGSGGPDTFGSSS